jgi:hypothetical protein
VQATFASPDTGEDARDYIEDPIRYNGVTPGIV